MIGFLLLIAVGVLFLIIGKNLEKDSLPKKEVCKLHKWTYRDVDTEQAYMVCDVCGMLPGRDDGATEEKPY